MRPMYKTVTISQEKAEQMGITKRNFASAGPYPNITGMKEKYWGLDALCVKCGPYVYKVDEITYLNCGGAL